MTLMSGGDPESAGYKTTMAHKDFGFNASITNYLQLTNDEIIANAFIALI